MKNQQDRQERTSSINSIIEEVLIDGGELVRDDNDTADLLLDWRKLYQGHAACVVRPASTREVGNVVSFCADHRYAVIPQGGNTGMCGGASPQNDDAILLNLRKMNKIRFISIEGRYVVAEAGVTLDEINAAVEKDGLFLPICFGAQSAATVGGVISTNAGGMNVLRYGMTRDQVLGLEVVLPNGTVWDGLRSNRKDNSGIDLKQLYIGAEGTLGIVTAACFKLVPLETSEATLLLEAETIEDVVSLGHMAQKIGGERLSNFELLSGFVIREGAVRILGVPSPIENVDHWFALVRFASATDVSDVCARFAEDAFEAGLAIDGIIPKSLSEEQSLWRIRDSMSELHREFGPSNRFDLAVPIDKIPTLIKELYSTVERYLAESDVLCFGHIGDGNIHFSVCSRTSNLPVTHDGSDFVDRINQVAWTLNGTMSAEHGIGRSHVAEMKSQKSRLEWETGQSIKSLLDPLGIMNPGVIYTN